MGSDRSVVTLCNVQVKVRGTGSNYSDLTCTLDAEDTVASDKG